MKQNEEGFVKVGFLGVVFIVLLVLKLTGVAAISWWWVFSPILIAVGLFALFSMFVLLAAALD